MILPGWLLAAVEGLLLVALIVGDPGRIDRTGPWQRRTSVAMVAVVGLVIARAVNAFT